MPQIDSRQKKIALRAPRYRTFISDSVNLHIPPSLFLLIQRSSFYTSDRLLRGDHRLSFFKRKERNGGLELTSLLREFNRTNLSAFFARAPPFFPRLHLSLIRYSILLNRAQELSFLPTCILLLCRRLTIHVIRPPPFLQGSYLYPQPSSTFHPFLLCPPSPPRLQHSSEMPASLF